MKLEITAESVAKAVYISWQVASEADTHERWLNAWGRVYSNLEGIWNTVNWSSGSTENDRSEAEILMEEIDLLLSIANHMRFNWRAK